MNVLPVQPATRRVHFALTPNETPGETPRFAGRLQHSDVFIEHRARHQNGWLRFLRWLALPQYQAVQPAQRAPRSKVDSLSGETRAFYQLLEEYKDAVYSGRIAIGGLDHYEKALSKIDTTKLANDDKAYHLIMSHDVGWRQAMQAQSLSMRYDHRLSTGDQTYRLGNPKNYVTRLLNENPFARSPEFNSGLGLDDVLSPAIPKRGIGKQTYEAILKHQIYTELSPEALIKTARADFDHWQTEMTALARQIDPKAKNWQQVYAEIQKNHPQRGDVLDTYRAETEKAKKFLIDHDLVDVPSGYTLRVQETPDQYKPDLPFAAYVPGRMAFWVTVTMNNDPKTEEAQLRAHNYADVKAVTVHEAFPGHHLDDLHKHADGTPLDRNDARTPGRKFLLNDAHWDSAPYSEGWGLYSETMMYDHGYYDNASDPKDTAAKKLTARRCMAWRAARAFLDAQIHTNQISYNEAVDFLVDNLVMQRDRAEAEINRYYQNPGQVTTYYLGMKQFHQIWDKAKSADPSLTLKQFHNAMLKQEMPVPAVALAQYGVEL